MHQTHTARSRSTRGLLRALELPDALRVIQKRSAELAVQAKKAFADDQSNVRGGNQLVAGEE